MGTGSEFGIPELGCDCPTCKSGDIKDKRERASIFLTTSDNKTIIIDAGCDFRDQILRENLRQMSAIILTDDQYSHIMGIDEIRPFTKDSSIPIFCSEKTKETLLKVYYYVFHVFQIGGGLPQMELKAIDNDFTVEGITVTPILCSSPKRESYGYRLGTFAYLPECKSISDESLSKLHGVETLVIGASGLKSHEDKLCIDEAIEYIIKIGAKRNYITHITHDNTYSDCSSYISKKVQDDPRLNGVSIDMGYDGLEIDNIIV